MDEYEPITGELRRKMDTLGWYDEDGNIVYAPGGKPVSEMACLVINSKTFGDLCDTIDSVHAQLERDYQTACEVNERQDADYARLKAERDSMAAALDAAQGEHAYAPESHYMMLPKDADGVPIHVGDVMEYAGDVMEWIDPGGDYSLVCEVCAVGIDCFFAWNKVTGRYTQKDAKAYHHYNKPTVEDVLTEFAAKLIERGGLTNGAAQTIADFAAKLRLADGKE